MIFFNSDKYYFPNYTVIYIEKVFFDYFDPYKALAGCVGATKHSKCMTWTYIIVMILLVVLEISASIAGYVKKDDVSKVLVNIAEDSMNNWNNTVVQSTWDQVQVKKMTKII